MRDLYIFQRSQYLMYWQVHHLAIYNHHIILAPSFLSKICWVSGIWRLPIEIPAFCSLVLLSGGSQNTQLSCSYLTLQLFHTFTGYLLCRSPCNNYQLFLNMWYPSVALDLEAVEHVPSEISALHFHHQFFGVAVQIGCYSMAWCTHFRSTCCTLLVDVSHQRV